MVAEKRKHTRFFTKEGTYAALGEHFSKVGKLQDISRAGLAFRYIENTENPNQNVSTVAIFVPENGFYLPDLACRLIYDAPLNSANSSRYFKTRFRIIRCGIKFTAVSEHQRDKLKFFLNHYIRGAMPLKKP
jgi:hypothetical protein